MKKFLLIAYYWPPCGGVSVQRWLKFTKYFSQYGWQPTVLTTENGDYPYIDNSLLEQIPADIKVVRTKTPTYNQWYRRLVGKNEQIPYGSMQTTKKDSFLKRMLFFIRVQLVSPDARKIWCPNAYKVAKKILLSEKYDAIITTGPPHSTHLVGLKLKKKFGIKWIADFQDPWTMIAYIANEKRNFIINKIDRNYEKMVVSRADVVVSVSEQFSQTLPEGNKVILQNAFDPVDFVDKQYHRADMFRIKYIGALFKSRVNEFVNIIDWLEGYARVNQVHNIEVSLVGAYEHIPEEIKSHLSFVKLRNIPFVPHSQAISECVDSETLLLIIHQAKSSKGLLTFKLYEYLASKTIIFSIAPKDSDMEAILRDTQGGVVIDYDDKDGFLASFDTLYKKWLKGESIKNQNDVSQYSAPSVCEQYARLLDDITHIR